LNFIDNLIIITILIVAIFRITNTVDFNALQIDPATANYIPLAPLAANIYLENIFLAILVFLSWFKALNFLRIWQRLGILIIIFSKMLIEVIVFFGFLILFLFAFASALFLVSGRNNVLFSTYGSCLVTLFRGILADLELASLLAKGDIIALLIMILFLVLSAILLMNLLIAILNNAYNEVKGESRRNWCIYQAKMLNEFGEKMDIEGRKALNQNDATEMKRFPQSTETL